MTQYSGVYTLQQQGQALTSGQWATDPYYKNTTLLLHADGVAGGAQNNTFLDSSTNAFAITRNGNTTQGSFTPYGPDWSNYFGATGSYLSVPYSSDFNLTGDFTVEFWVNPTYLPTTTSSGQTQGYCRLFSFGTFNAANSIGLEINSDFGSNVRTFYCWYNGSSYQLSANNAVTSNAWQHIAMVRSGTVISLYVNGVSTGFTITGASAAINTGQSLYIAVLQGYESTAAAQYLGYISNFSILKGTAKYTANFTPTTAPLPTNTANQTLLTCTSNRFFDANTTTTAKTITPNGTSSVQRFSPFPPQYQYTTAVIGGSAYFDGSGDYLSAGSDSAFAFGTGAYTVECWIYPTSVSQQCYVTNDTTNGSVFYFETNSSNGFSIAPRSGAIILSGGYSSLKPNQWHHVVYCRASTSANQTSIFVNGTRVANGTDSTNWTITGPCVLGGLVANIYMLSGNMGDVRVVKGTDVYGYSNTTITVPTAPLSAISGTSLLCNMTNAGIYDNAMMNDLETVGNAQVSTNVVKYGSGSMYYPGSSSYLSTASNKSAQFGSGDFTIEGWLYPTSISGANVIHCYGYQTTTTRSSLAYLYAGNFRFGYSPDGSTNNDVSLGAHNMTANNWYHFAVVRTNGVVTAYVNGIALSSPYTISTNAVYNSPSNLIVGSDTSGNDFVGYIDDYRITKGVARYTSNFIPPKVAFANQ